MRVYYIKSKNIILIVILINWSDSAERVFYSHYGVAIPYNFVSYFPK